LFWQIYHAPPLAAARARLGDAGWAAGYAAGHGLSLTEAVTEALGSAV